MTVTLDRGHDQPIYSEGGAIGVTPKKPKQRKKAVRKLVKKRPKGIV